MKKLITIIAVSVVTMLFSFTAFSQEVWKKTSLKNSVLKENKTSLPENTIFYSLGEDVLQLQLENAPKRGEGAISAGPVISLPNVEGKMIDFYVLEASNFSPGLAEKFPNIKAYRGVGVNNPEIGVNFSFSHLGLKAMITGYADATIFIEPVTQDNQVYASYSKLRKNKEAQFTCLTEEDQDFADKTFGKVTTTEGLNADDQTLRTFRLAVSVTGEYTQYFGGTVEDAMAAINATMTRVNAIYERDLAVNMELIANNDAIIYTSANTDPYSPASTGMDPHPVYGGPPYYAGNWNYELQQNLTAVVGEGNYDIGHLFGASGGGGNAGCIGCVCETDAVTGKGSGYTSPADGVPEGDSFDIDFVAHEMGHQFGGNHTFSRSENSGANMEPGSGTTIMGYAGITGATDVQPHSDDLFHFYSIYQITENVKNKTCPVETSLTNTPPTVDAGASYTIPKGTAFKLTATATDAEGDPLTYSWEQADVSTSNSFSFPNPNATNGPIFRAKQMTTEATRYFPSFDKVLDGNLYSTWETVSDVSRQIKFVVQVRDNNANIGQTGSDNTVVTVGNSNGAFTLNSIEEGESIFPGGEYNLTWNVAGTNVAPYNSPTVNVLLSVDGGETFDILVAGTANDGSETFTIPADAWAQEAYLMIESVGNIFYAVSPEFLIGYEAQVTCQSFSPSDETPLPASIPDGAGANTYGPYRLISFDVPEFGTGVVSDVNVTVDVTHSYINDLQIELRSPGSTPEIVALWNRECSNQQNINVVFDDDGSSISCGSPTTGTFKPSDELEAMNGLEAVGEWVFAARDGYNVDAGTLNDVVLEICTIEYVTMGTNNPVVSLEDQFEIFPNPANDVINIRFKENVENISYNMYDMLGRRIISLNNTSQQQINISQFPAGVYLLEIQSGEVKTTKRIIKN